MSFFFPGNKKAKPQFTGLQTQTSTSNLPIPICIGRNRLSPNIIWQGDFKALKQKQGKGGGKGMTSYKYSASFDLGLCWGPLDADAVIRMWKDKGQSETSEVSDVTFSFFRGVVPQDPWGYMTAKHPDEALGYPGIAHTAIANYDLGQTNLLGQHNFELKGLLHHTGIGGASNGDADPALAVELFLTDPGFGVGFDMDVITNMFSTADAGTIGDGTFQTYCRAMGFALSPYLTDQKPGGEIVQSWAELCNTAVVWNGYNIKLHPYGAEAVTANGVKYVPNFPIRYELGGDDFIHDIGSDPISVSRTNPADVKNSLSIVIKNRANEYNDLPIPWLDQGLADQYGLREATSIDAPSVTEISMAEVMVALIGQREAYIRNEFTFMLPVKYCLLEPMDVVLIKDEVMGSFYVLLQSVEETETDSLQITAKEYIEAISLPTANVGQPVTNTPQNSMVPPGPINPPIIFEPPSSLTGSPQVWAAVSGGDGTTANENWGGAFVWLSTDGVNYQQIGEVRDAARQGKLSAELLLIGEGGSIVTPPAPEPDEPIATVPSATVNDVTVNETSSTLVYTITRTGDLSAESTINYVTVDGEALAGVDYTSTSGSVVFAINETTKTVSVPVLQDPNYEVNEAFYLRLTATTNITIADTQGQGIIVSEDAAPATVPTVTIANATFNENAGVVNFILTRTGDTRASSTVNFATANGTATAGSDYTATSGSVVFAIGETTQVIPVTMLNDSTYELDETFLMNLTAGNNVLIGDSQATATIKSDDAAPAEPSSPPGTMLTGVNLAIAEFGSTVPGYINRDYAYPNDDTIDYFTSASFKDMGLVRIPVKMERIQDGLFGPLNATNIAQLDRCINKATANGADVLIDFHNYMRLTINGTKYLIANDTVSTANRTHVSDAWAKVAARYMNNPKVRFNLMNEPHDMETSDMIGIYQAMLDAIAGTGATNRCYVSGNRYSGASKFGDTEHNDIVKTMTDPRGQPLRFDVHQYPDTNYSGTPTNPPNLTIGSRAVDQMQKFTTFARANGFKGLLGEFAGNNTTDFRTQVELQLEHMENNLDVWDEGNTWWAAGQWWGSYPYSMQPTGVRGSWTDKPQMAWLDPYI